MLKLRSLLVLVLTLPLLGVGPCDDPGQGMAFRVLSPESGELAAGGRLNVTLAVPGDGSSFELDFFIDGARPLTVVSLPTTGRNPVFSIGPVSNG